MALNPKLIGKSLLKFYKPLRVGQLERDPSELNRPSCGYILNSTNTAKKSQTQTTTNEAPSASAPVEKQDEHPTHRSAPSENASWLDQVEYLSDMCKKVTHKLSGSFGSQTYKEVVDSQVRQKIKVVGSIINLTDSKDDPLKITLTENSKKSHKKKQKKSGKNKRDDEDQVELSSDDDDSESAA